jgi:hypothetical protein
MAVASPTAGSIIPVSKTLHCLGVYVEFCECTSAFAAVK